MKLLFTGIVSPWLVAFLFVVFSALTIFLYRRHHLPRPWSIWLPTIRIVVIALLLLALLQPVVARYRTVNVRGQIPVLVDTSGSMSLVDRYGLARQVEIAWNMTLFPRKLRNTVCADQVEPWREKEELVVSVETAAAELAAHLKGNAPWTKQFGRDVTAIADKLDGLGDEFGDVRKTIEKSIDDADYLTGPMTNRAGRLSYRVFETIPGLTLAALRQHPGFPDRPDTESFIESFDAPRNQTDNYGAVARGFLLPEKTGDYEFFLCANDAGELYLSPDDVPGRKRRIAYVSNAVPAGAWTSLESQKSEKIRLEAGETYFIEALFKEGAGEDHLVVGWRPPGAKETVVIPGARLAPYDPTDALSIFRAEYAAFVGRLDGLAETPGRIADAVREVNDAKVKDPEALVQLLEELHEYVVEFRGLAARLEGLQALADERLALAGIEKVDDALDRLATMERSDLAQYLLTEKPYRLLDRLGEKGEVDVFSFAENPEVVTEDHYTNLVGELAATRIGSTVAAVLKQYEKRPISAFVLISDGINNAGKPLSAVRELLEEQGVPVIALGVGSPTPPPDVAIARISAPRTSFLDDRLGVSVVLKREGYLDRPILLKVLSGDEVLREATVEPGEDTQVVHDLSFVEKTGGMRSYTVVAEQFDGEAFDHNNRKSFSVNILEDRIRTLLIDEFPRWESRYANMMLKRDRRVDLRTIFIASAENGQMPVGEEGYPATRDELFGYHIVILGDVNPNHLDTERMSDLRDFVVKRGGSLIVMAGEHYMPERYVGTPIADLIPLRRFAGAGRGSPPSEDEDENSARAGRFRLRLAPENRFHDVVQVGGNPDESEQLWEELPGMNWVREGVVGSRAAELLVRGFPAAELKGTGRRRAGVPVMVSAFTGLGNVLYLGSDSFWRWRYRARWTYHHRFWGQVLLWATMGRTTGSDKYVKLMTDRPVYAPEEVITVKARLLDENEVPIKDGQAIIEIMDENDELVKRVPLVYLENSGGEYRAQLRQLPRGQYRLVPRVEELADKDVSATVKVEVRDLPTSEYIELKLDETQLAGLADSVVPFDVAGEIVEDVPKIDFDTEHRDDTEIWDSLPFMLLIALLLGLEWLLRKKIKLA